METGQEVNNIDEQIAMLDARKELLQKTEETLPEEEQTINWVRTKKKQVKGEWFEFPYVHSDNTKVMLDHFGVDVKYNEMTKNVEIDIPNGDFHQDTELNAKMVCVYDLANVVGYPKEQIDSHIGFIANQNPYHPVRDWIKSEEWDGLSRITQYFETIKSDTEMKELLMIRWALMCVAAIFEPEGIRPQGVLTFEGKQGLGKTTWLYSMIGNKDWISEGESLDPHDKDSVERIIGHWIVELGEIQSTFKKSDVQALKAFITKDRDKFRPAYERKANEYRRRTCFFGTVDEKRFLTDLNGTRRFWTISVDDINLGHGINLQQFWREIYELYLQGERWHLNRDEIDRLNISNEEYMPIDPIEEVMKWVSWDESDGRKPEFLSATEICKQLNLPKISKAETNLVARILEKVGVERNRRRKFKVHIRDH